MATIQEYSAPNATGVIRPSETGEQATARAALMGERRAAVTGDMYARAISLPGRPIEQAAKLVDEHLTQSDMSVKGAEGIKMSNDYGQMFNDYAKNATPEQQGDPTFFQKFYDEKWLPAVQKWQDGFRTTRGAEWGQQHAMAMSEHMQNVVTAGAGEAAGSAIIINHQKSVQEAVDGVAKAPESLHINLDLLKSQEDAMLSNPNLTLAQRDRVREEFQKSHAAVAESAFNARLAINPSAALADVKNGIFNGMGIDTGHFLNMATTQVREAQQRAQADALRGMEMQRIQRANTSEAAAKSWWSQSMEWDATTRTFVPNAQAGDNFQKMRGSMMSGEQERINGVLSIGARQVEAPHDDPSLVQDRTNRVMSGDPSVVKDLLLDMAAHKMTEQTARPLIAAMSSDTTKVLLEDPSVKAGFAGGEQMIERAVTTADLSIKAGNLFQNASVQGAVQQWRSDALAKLGAAKTQAEAAALFDPSSPHSLTSQTAIARIAAIAIGNQFKADNPKVNFTGVTWRGDGDTIEGVLARLTSATKKPEITPAPSSVMPKVEEPYVPMHGPGRGQAQPGPLDALGTAIQGLQELNRGPGPRYPNRGVQIPAMKGLVGGALPQVNY